MCPQNHRWGLGYMEACKSGHKVTVLHEKQTQMRAGTHINMSFCCKSSSFACTKWQIISGAHRDLLFWSRSRYCTCKNHRWGLGPTETCNSSPKGAVFHAQNHRWVLEPIQSFYSCVKHAVMCPHNHRWGLGPISTWNSGQKCALLHAKTTHWGWDP